MLMMAVVVSILATESDTPEIRVSPVGYKSAVACERWQSHMNAQILGTIDKISGKRLTAVQYQCVPIDGAEELRDLQNALSAGN